jgi:hypothetical protein
MLPLAHVELTWAAANSLQRTRRSCRWPYLDYRLLALVALAPDLLDKPLAIFVFRQSGAALLFGHTLLLHVAVWIVVAAARRVRRWLPYLLALSGHLIADRMWGFGDTLLWPLRGTRFHQWKHVGSPAAFVRAYLGIVLEEPKLLWFELAGLVALVWLIVDRRLYRKDALSRFLRTGRVGAPEDG